MISMDLGFLNSMKFYVRTHISTAKRRRGTSGELESNTQQSMLRQLIFTPKSHHAVRLSTGEANFIWGYNSVERALDRQCVALSNEGDGARNRQT